MTNTAGPPHLRLAKIMGIAWLPFNESSLIHVGSEAWVYDLSKTEEAASFLFGHFIPEMSSRGFPRWFANVTAEKYCFYFEALPIEGTNLCGVGYGFTLISAALMAAERVLIMKEIERKW